jgi:hypothetical protein
VTLFFFFLSDAIPDVRVRRVLISRISGSLYVIKNVAPWNFAWVVSSSGSLLPGFFALRACNAGWSRFATLVTEVLPDNHIEGNRGAIEILPLCTLGIP